MRYENILLAFDTSDHACRALEEAYALYSHGLAENLIVLSVYDPLKSSDPTQNVAARIAGVVYAGNPILEEDLRKNIKKKIKNLLGSAATDLEIMVTTGKASDKILEVSKEKNCGLIVVGSRGLGSFAGSVLGSVSSEIIRESQLPVLVVK